ncbi:MAG: glycosyltransferase [Thermoanaerobaculia bacterium]
MKISVVIAAYDERENIEKLTLRLHRTLSALGEPFEILYVVDGLDGTRQIVEGLAAELGAIRMLYGETPSGLGHAFRRGFAALQPDTDVVVTLDADLNHQPEEIPRLVEELKTRCADIVIGSRVAAGHLVEGIPLWKRTLSVVINAWMRLFFGIPIGDKTSGFRVYRSSVLRELPYENDDFAFLPEMLILACRKGLVIHEAPIHFIYRTEGRSKMGFVSTSFSYLRLLFRRRR